MYCVPGANQVAGRRLCSPALLSLDMCKQQKDTHTQPSISPACFYTALPSPRPGYRRRCPHLRGSAPHLYLTGKLLRCVQLGLSLAANAAFITRLKFCMVLLCVLVRTDHFRKCKESFVSIFILLLLSPSWKWIRALFSVCLAFFFVKSQLELVRVTRETSRNRHRRYPSRQGLAQTEHLRAGYRFNSWSYWAGNWDLRRGPCRAFDMLEISVP